MKRFFALAVFILGAVLFASAFASRDYRPAARAVKVTYLLSQTVDGSLEPTGLIERGVLADGRYRETARGFDGNSWTKIANDDGVFTQQHGAGWQFLSDFKARSLDSLYRSKKFLKSLPQLIGTEDLLGYKTYIVRVGDSNGGVSQWFAPELGNTPLKTVVEQDGFFRVIEAVRIEFVDVAESQVAVTGALGFESAARRAEDYRNNGNPSRAVALEQVVERAKAAQK